MADASMEATVARVGTVDDVPSGGEVLGDHPVGATTLTLADAADFPEDGGQVSLPNGLVVPYTAADLEADTLTLAEPLEEPVVDGTGVFVFPLAVTRVATVSIDGQDDGQRVRVPQDLLDQVPTGLRDEESSETVLVDLVEGQWQVADLLAVPSRAVRHGDPYWVEDSEGGHAGGLADDGSVEGPEGRFGSVVIGGDDVMGTITQRSLPLGRDGTTLGTIYGPYTVDMPLWEGVFDVPAGHRVRLRARGHTRGTAGQSVNLRASYTVTDDGSMPPVPWGSDEELRPHAPFTHPSNGWEARTWEWDFGGTESRWRVLVWLQPVPSSGGISARDWVFTPEISATHGASGFAGQVRAQEGAQGSTPPAPPTPPLVGVSREFDLGSHTLYSRGNRITVGQHVNYLATGRSPSHLYRTWIQVPSAVRNYIATLEDYTSAEVFLRVDDAYGGSVRPYFGTSTASGFTQSEQGWGNRGQGSRTYSTSATSGWTTMPTAVRNSLATSPMLIMDYTGTSQGFMRWRRSARIRIRGKTRT